MNIAVGVRGAIVQNKPPAIFPKLTQLLIQVDSVPMSYSYLLRTPCYINITG